jgi:putative salt-induced outer membrane protein YdiY
MTALNSQLMAKTVFGLMLFMALMLSSAAAVFARAKTDTIVLVNGDTITGEIKSLYRGKLKFKTDAMSTVYVEWEDIVTLTSEYYFEIEENDGYKYYGTPSLEEGGEFRITRADIVVSLEKLQVVRITPIEKTFWSRIDGSVSLGISYTRSSDIGRFEFAFDTHYREEKNYFEVTAMTTTTTESDDRTTQRTEATASYQRTFQRRLFWDTTWTGFQNDEMGVALRLTLGSGLGAHLIQSNWTVLESSLGLQVTREWPTDVVQPPSNNLEGVITLAYSLWKYNTPKTDLTASVSAFPSLPDFDRYRLDSEIILTQEIVSDFMLVFTWWDNYDSQPPSEGAAKNDFGVTTSIGYTW